MRFTCAVMVNNVAIKNKLVCRLYEGSYRVLEDKFGEDCDVNTELTD